jgi:hypothetical protein
MSFTWTPIPKPAEGREDIFNGIAGKILGFFGDEKAVEISYKDAAPLVRRLLDELAAVSVSPYQTLDIPVIGEDPAATQYYLEKFAEAYKQPFNPDKVVAQVAGAYATGMITGCDGISRVYGLKDGEAYDFDASEMTDCILIMNPFVNLESAFDKTAEEAIAYGKKLRAIADALIAEHHLEYLRETEEKPGADVKRGRQLVHFLLAASAWLIFWGSHGHGIRTKME